MDKKTRLILIVGAVAVGGYLAYTWYKNRQSTSGSLGSNLNSVAPNLVGGSTGPAAGPAVDMPINITLSETAASTQPEQPGPSMRGANAGVVSHPLYRSKISVPGTAQGMGYYS